jgi:tetratricopeptide (TPR) repeat protein
MFTINIYLKFALIAAFLGGGIILAFSISFWYALPLIIIGLIFLASYIFLGTIQSSAMLMQKMDFDACEKRLALTFKPNWLYVTNRAYYFLIKGSIAMQRNNSDDAEAWFQKAQNLKLPSDNEKAMILIQMINIHLTKNRYTQANNAYRELKKLHLTTDMFKDQIKMLDDVMKQQGRMKMTGQMDQRMMFRPGGKRRMPRMR